MRNAPNCEAAVGTVLSASQRASGVWLKLAAVVW